MRKRWRRSYRSGKVMMPMRRRKSGFVVPVKMGSRDEETGCELQLEDRLWGWKLPGKISKKVRARKIKGRRIKVNVEGDNSFLEKLGKQVMVVIIQ